RQLLPIFGGGPGVARLSCQNTAIDYFESALSRAAISGPILGGLGSTPTLMPNSASAALHTGPTDAMSVALRPEASASLRPSVSASANRLYACEALVNTAASTRCPSNASMSATMGAVS